MDKKVFRNFLVVAILILIVILSATIVYSRTSLTKISDWNYCQLQRIDKTKKEFSFAVFGDNRSSVKIFENLIEGLNKEDVIFAIDCGDLVYGGKKKEFQFFLGQIKKCNKPFLTAIGNHDIIKNGRGYYYKLFGRFYYSFAIGNSYFIILDNADEHELGLWQMDWLKDKLQKSQNYKYRFVFMHVPLYDPRKGDYKIGHSMKDLVIIKKLNNLFDKNNTTMLFVSHIHGYYRGVWGKTPYTITGGAGAPLYGSDLKHFFYHYIKVNVFEDEVEYKVVKIKKS
jgi:hypothetical protein